MLLGSSSRSTHVWRRSAPARWTKAMATFLEALHLPMGVNAGPCAWSASTLPHPQTAIPA